jgi:signal transduction histidine kinase
MDRLIDNLLAYTTASDSALKPELVDLQQIVTDVIAEQTANLLADDHADGAAAALPPAISAWPLPTVYADPAMMRQLFDNLIGNALRFAVPNEPARIDIMARPEVDHRIGVEVSDRGVGIPAGQHDKVFTQFHRPHTRGAHTGTGLGLAICARIVERHGGTITVTDNPGGGCRFRFTLPGASDATRSH